MVALEKGSGARLVGHGHTRTGQATYLTSGRIQRTTAQRQSASMSPGKGQSVIIDRDVLPQDIRIMFDYSGRKRDGSNAAPQRGIRPWEGDPKAGKRELMIAAQKFLLEKFPRERCRVLSAGLLPPVSPKA